MNRTPKECRTLSLQRTRTRRAPLKLSVRLVADRGQEVVLRSREGPRRNPYGRAGRMAQGRHRGWPSAVQTHLEAWAGDHQRASGRRYAEGNAGVDHATGGTRAREEIMKRQYLVRIDKDVDSDWGASVPDLPGCVATGKTIDAALRRIEGAIELHVRGLREDGIRVPPPRQRAVKPRRTRRQVNFYATVEVAA